MENTPEAASAVHARIRQLRSIKKVDTCNTSKSAASGITMKPSQLQFLRSLAYNTSNTRSRLCYSCATRQFRTFAPLRQQVAASKAEPNSPIPSPKQPKLPDVPESPKGTSKFTLQTLGRPIGASYPPRPGDNDPTDRRTLSQRNADFTNYDKHLQRRKELTAQISKPYFRDWKNLKYAKGKGWIANERLWKKDVSLWMPNLVGRTLDKAGDKESGGQRDLCSVLGGRVSIVAIYSRTWALDQVKTWIEAPEVQELIKMSGGKAQLIDINVEEQRLYKLVLKMFEGSLRRMRRNEDWGKYFFVNGIPDTVRELIGVMNSRAGYIYLVDAECRIRWAGSGDAEVQEKEALVKCLKRLIEERKGAREEKATKIEKTLES
jgi:ATPase complex subunit ATP10